MPQNDLAQLIQEELQRRRLTLSDAARISGLSEATLSRLQNGRVRDGVHFATEKKLIKLLGERVVPLIEKSRGNRIVAAKPDSARVPESSHTKSMITISDDSMSPFIQEFMLIETVPADLDGLTDGCVYYLDRGGTGVIRQIFQEHNHLKLVPFNSDRNRYPIEFARPSDFDSARLVSALHVKLSARPLT